MKGRTPWCHGGDSLHGLSIAMGEGGHTPHFQRRAHAEASLELGLILALSPLWDQGCD